MNLLPRQLTGATSTSSLNPLTRMPIIPHSMFSLLAVRNKPDLLSYRCVPAGFWLKDNDSGKIKINNTFFFLSNCYMLDHCFQYNSIGMQLLVLLFRFKSRGRWPQIAEVPFQSLTATGRNLQFGLCLPDFRSCIFSHCYSVSFISFSFRSYVRCASLVTRICMINTSPLLISPLKWWTFWKMSTSVNVCILDFCSFNVTVTESFWHKYTEYVQHQKKYFKMITLSFGGVHNCEMEQILKNRFVRKVVLHLDFSRRELISCLYFVFLLFK